jgi:hypothetical protein
MEHASTTQKRRANDAHESEFSHCPRYDRHELSLEQIDELTTQAAIKAVNLAKENFYQGVGEQIINKIFWLIGLCAVGLLVAAIKMGWVKQ